MTNVGQKLHHNIRHGIRELPETTPAVPELDGRTGLVISLNILSQLWVLPRAYALKKMRGLDEEQLDDWCRRIVESHYLFLRSLPCSVRLIADYEFTKRGRDAGIVSRDSTIFGLAPHGCVNTWAWNIIPPGEDRFLSKELTVGVWDIEC